MPLLTDPVKNSEAHPNHPIKLVTINQPFRCDGCNELGIGVGFVCISDCRKTFHQECVRPQDVTPNSLCCNNCRFTFRRPSATENTNHRICDACGTRATGFYFGCSNNHHRRHYIHPSCMKLDHRLKLDGNSLFLRGNVVTKCKVCKSKYPFAGMVNGWSYATVDDKVCWHIKCAKDVLVEKWEIQNLKEPKFIGSSSGGGGAVRPLKILALPAAPIKKKVVDAAPKKKKSSG